MFFPLYLGNSLCEGFGPTIQYKNTQRDFPIKMLYFHFKLCSSVPAQIFLTDAAPPFRDWMGEQNHFP